MPNRRSEDVVPQGINSAFSPGQRTLRAKVAAHTSWANTKDRPARTAKARNALQNRFLTEADGDPVRAESLRKAFYASLALKSATARRLRAAGKSVGVSDAEA